MKYLSLVLFVLGICLLFFIFYSQKPVTLSSQKDLEKLNDNTLVTLTGIVTNEKTFEKVKYLTINNIEVTCLSCPNSYKNHFVKIKGIISSYQNKKEIRVLSIQQE